MIRVLAAVLSPKSPFFHSVHTEWRIQTLVSRTEKSLQYFSRPGSCYRCHPQNTFRSGRAQPPERGRLGFPENEAQGLGAHAARMARTVALRPRSTPLMSPWSFVSPCHKYNGDPRSRTGLQNGQAIVREGAQRQVIKVYIHICR